VGSANATPVAAKPPPMTAAATPPTIRRLLSVIVSPLLPPDIWAGLPQAARYARSGRTLGRERVSGQDAGMNIG
jgi:hypothetical protein